MKICVQGMWHLGSVTAACLASLGHHVTGYEPDAKVVSGLCQGRAPLFEPGLDALIHDGIAFGRLGFTGDPAAASRDASVLWVTFDTPVDEDDHADTGRVLAEVERMLGHLQVGTMVLISSQLPVGSVASLERLAALRFPQRNLRFAYSPENLRLGKALEVFLNPDRIVVGVRDETDRDILAPLLGTLTKHVEWMSVESAEMTKHAINSFLALSVTFANELAAICEAVGADAKQVERGLKTESRIGPRAYLAPGVAFAGGTLARDVAFLEDVAERHGCRVPLLSAVRPSNEWHKGWTARKLEEVLGGLRGARIAVWGLTYKPDTDTLRRSVAIELCRTLMAGGVSLAVHDPVVPSLPDDMEGKVVRADNPLAALDGAAALVVCTEWPEYRGVTSADVARMAPGVHIVDPSRFLKQLANQPLVHYHAVGTPDAKGPMT